MRNESVPARILKRVRPTIAGILGVTISLGAAPVVNAQEMEVPVTLQIPLFLKVMSFDRAFAARTGRTLVIAVVYQRGNRASLEARDEALLAIARTPRSADGVERRGIAVDLDSELLAPRLVRESADIVYITPLRSVDIRRVVMAAEDAGASTWTGVASYVAHGVSVGVRLERDRPRIVINLDASHRQKTDFSSELLKLADVK
jgi:YfiR/HmsC-like